MNVSNTAPEVSGWYLHVFTSKEHPKKAQWFIIISRSSPHFLRHTGHAVNPLYVASSKLAMLAVWPCGDEKIP